MHLAQECPLVGITGLPDAWLELFRWMSRVTPIIVWNLRRPARMVTY